MKDGLHMDEIGTKWWTKDGVYHRNDGPSVELLSGYKAWFIKGKRRRDDGHAVEWSDGSKAWYIEGNLHRIDGPAIENANGYKEWWIDGKQYNERDYWKKLWDLGYIDETEMMINLI